MQRPHKMRAEIQRRLQSCPLDEEKTMCFLHVPYPDSSQSVRESLAVKKISAGSNIKERATALTKEDIVDNEDA